jgi:sterol desaturase/sphingolipid hydroxylase (fatty acid hydroxylase superfamily)
LIHVIDLGEDEMPTPIEILMDPISLGVLALYAALMICEAIAPGRRLASVRGWVPRALASFGVYFYLSSYLPLIWDGYLAQYQFFDLSGLGTLAGAAIGVVVYEGLVYAWHRALHQSAWLFRSFHQMHHSAERLDTYGAFYFSPLDMAGFTLVGSLSLSLIVGLSAQAVTVFLFVTMFLGIFQHTNIRTPAWLGYFVQRPESHTIHHGKGLHSYNYSDLPVFDMLFGTFRNPQGYEMDTGFYDGASTRIIDMLLGRDISMDDRQPVEPEAVNNVAKA